ncbi:MAG: glycosyltransferase family 2 protein [Lachnospiraceae bacterium]|nr:glycosyltransferase family 2 protein [Lachnospiraceae bacterium]
MLLSVIVPCYNEEGNIDLFYEQTVKALGDLMPQTELIFVNDGSRDGTLAKLRALCSRAQYRVRVVSFSRNFGKEAALLAGLRSSQGDFTVIIDADLQQNPAYIVKMMKILEDHPEYDAVAAYQEERRENALISLIKKTFYKVMDSMTDIKIMQAASDFRLMRRPVVDAILSLPEKCRFSKGIFAWVGFETYYMPYEVEDRASGTSKWNFWKLLTYAFDGIVAFSNKPLILSSVVGFFIFCLSILYLIIIVIKTILWGDPVAGFPTLACLILMLSGIQLLGIGILGQYMAKNYTETKGRPVYVVKEELDSAKKEG